MTPFVIDCSVTMAWCFPDEASAYADAALDALRNSEAHVPALRPLEVANVLAIGERRGRLAPSETTQFLDLLHRLPIIIDHDTPDRAFGDILSLARAHHLTSYDAAYLELAARRSLPLCTLDERLKRAAGALGVTLFTG